MTGFAVRYGSTVHAYLNRCAHVPMELDWVEGRFFDADGAALICSTHGAVYTPDTGVCIGGPCCGSRLRAIVVLERDGQVYWCPDDYVEPAIADAMATQQSDHNGQSGI
jgi:nitrite reductase/ring-hydroxylating ferredoxin subunit